MRSGIIAVGQKNISIHREIISREISYQKKANPLAVECHDIPQPPCMIKISGEVLGLSPVGDAGVY